MSNFWIGFEKRAGAGVLEPFSAVGGAIGGRTDKAKESNTVKAKAHASNVVDAKKTRKQNIMQYLINPETPGPFSEIGHRLSRRHRASMVEHPTRTALIPLYGEIRGGKAGEKDVK
jgi:hypothetical protein